MSNLTAEVQLRVIKRMGDAELEKELAFARSFGLKDEAAKTWLAQLEAEQRSRDAQS